VLPPEAPLVLTPPFRSPHHSASLAALVGGGSRWLRPGAASLAHRGVLFLDEAPEFAPKVLDALRQPLESGFVEVARASGVARFPARFTLVLAANPCPCGKSGTPKGDALCICRPHMRLSYRQRLSGPLLDRVDVRVRLEPPSRNELSGTVSDSEATSVVAARVAQAREAAAKRLVGTPWRSMADVPGPQLRSHWDLPRAVRKASDTQFDKGHLSARGRDRVLRTAWTLADLAGEPAPRACHVEQALNLRLTGGA
jgi:magnesium chelatase family protein